VDVHFFAASADHGEAIGSPSSAAGSALPATGTYYAKVRHFSSASLPGTIRPYDFYVRVLSGSPIPETEPNNKGAPRVPRSNGWGAV
jgi:hypothetical protein